MINLRILDYKNKINTFTLGTLLFCVFCSCDNNQRQVMDFAGDNRVELEKVLAHYKETGDKQKLKAAEFLINYMGYGKFSYTGEIIQKYDKILILFDSLRKDSVFVGDPAIINNTWDSIKNRYGEINIASLTKKHDCQNIKSYFLIKNIDAAFYSWQKSRFYNPKDFNLFCEYILPYRVENEPVEEYRTRYYMKYRHIIDTAKTNLGIIKGFNDELMQKEQFRSSKKLWDYPLDLPISKMEIAHRGACRQLTTFGALVMRACGLPVTIDRAIWANRSLGHSWTVLLLDSGKILPFDALERRKIEFAYIPAKIFRKKYSYDLKLANELNYNDVPKSVMNIDEKDVTSEYCKAYDLEIPIQFSHPEFKNKKYCVIGVFDNKKWKVVYYGLIKSDKMYFKKMASGVAYITGFYDKGTIIPASEPFLIRENGSLSYCKANNARRINLKLKRKYPRFKKIEEHAKMGLQDANFQGANYSNFKDSMILFSIVNVPFQLTDSFVSFNKRFRFIRFYSAISRNANLAEAEFYGKKFRYSKEEKLHGKIIGYPLLNSKNENPYTKALDGNLETWFDKPRNTIGWVVFDLGKGNKYFITRVRFCPRSDTNFILAGDKYELYYWAGKWISGGMKTAKDSILNYDNIPSGTIYLLHNHTRGKEERIFTYEKEKQIWW